MPDLLAPVQEAFAGRYSVDREIGTGGTATVYRARDLRHDRVVAVKVLRPELAAALGTERFLREIQIAARLQHPNILPLYDSGEVHGLPYYVMPHVEGESLRRRLEREKQLVVDDAIGITHEIADALDYAHGEGVVHRDIKPANILLEAGHAVVADFGIALAVSSAGERLTEQGISVGTPEYMSPEQASAEQTLDGRSDLYSLACVLYEMLAGQPPFTGASARAVMARHVVDPVPPLKTARPQVPNHVHRVLIKALAKVPQDRFATVQQFAAALVNPMPAFDLLGAPSIAVLPFANMSANPENEYLSDGISEEITNALTKIEGFHVASRTSAFALKHVGEDIRTIGERLNVNAILEGSVRRSGDRLRITAQLIDIATGYHQWSERFDRGIEDVFAVQDEIAESVVRALKVVLRDEQRNPIQQVQTANVEAYDYYLRGRHFFHQFRKKGLEYACEMYTRAIEADSTYALAHTGLADACAFLHMYFATGQADLERADVASREALTLAPELANAHASRGLALMLRKRYDDAEEEFERARALDSSLFEASYFYGRACMQQGKLAEAATLFEDSCRIREDYQARLLAAQAYAGLRGDAAAERAYNEAFRVIERHLELLPGDARALTLGAGALAHLGRDVEALEWVDRALAIDPHDAVVAYAIACVYAVMGHVERALAMLERAVQAGFRSKDWIEHDPDFAELRRHPRVQELLASL